MAVEVEEAMDEIESAFALRIMRVRGGLTGGGVSADEDFAVLEGDDVGWRGIVHELRVGRADDGVGDEGDFDFLKIREQCGMRTGMFQHQREGLRRHMDEALDVERQRGLMVVEFERGHEGKAASGLNGCKQEWRHSPPVAARSFRPPVISRQMERKK